MGERSRPYAHVLRVAGFFLFGFAVFLVVRWALVPADFGRLGFYRAARSTVPARSRSGTPAKPPASTVTRSRRSCARARGTSACECEACHGPLARHADGDFDNDKPRALNPRLFCWPCHAELGRPPRARPADGSDRSRRRRGVQRVPQAASAEGRGP